MDTYLVGGMVRDNIMGMPSKDADFSVVLSESDMVGHSDPFAVMRDELIRRGFKIFVETPEHYTIRAQFPPNYEFQGFDAASGRMVTEPRKGLTADFVLAREEGPYSDGRRPDWVKAGTLLMDLQRRDFCFNAIAKDADGSYIDPFNGRADIDARIIRAVGDPVDRLMEDALRAVRAVRFAVTKRFYIEDNLAYAIQQENVLYSLRRNISDERIQQELSKMFRFDTIESLRTLAKYPHLTDALFSGSVSLDATMKQKGRG